MEATPGALRPWLFRGLLVIGAGLMLVSWYLPWWSGHISNIALGKDHLAVHPWGVEVMDLIAPMVVDRTPYAMPGFFAPLMWVYLAACMAALLASLFVERKIALGRFKVSLPEALIALVGVSYLIATLSAIAIAAMWAHSAGFQLLGSTTFSNRGGAFEVLIPVAKPKDEESVMTGALMPGYWLAVATGPFLIALALLRNIIVGKARA